MGKMTRRWPIVVGIIAILFLATACFQQVGDEAQGQAISVRISDTPTPLPSHTPIPEPTDIPTELEAQDVPILDNPTATETASPSNTPIEVAQGSDPFAQPTQDPFEITATYLIQKATLDFVLPTTQAAQALGIGLTTPTDIPTATQFGLVAPVSSIGTDCIYEVRAGDTLWNISQRFGLSVMDIVTPNGISNFNLIVVGDRLTIPRCGTTGYFPPATSTPIPSITPYGFGQTTDANAATFQQVPVTCVSQYTIQQYDTLFTLSVRFGVAIQSIMNANSDKIYDPGRINMGDSICIPSQ
jgi:LysM repeat protein